MLLEEFSKERLVGEVQFFRNLLNVVRGVSQHDAYLGHHIVVNPLVRRTTADGLD